MRCWRLHQHPETAVSPRLYARVTYSGSHLTSSSILPTPSGSQTFGVSPLGFSVSMQRHSLAQPISMSNLNHFKMTLNTGVSWALSEHLSLVLLQLYLSPYYYFTGVPKAISCHSHYQKYVVSFIIRMTKE